MSNTDIQALLNGSAAIQTKIEILPQVAGESSITLTESNGVVSWDYEDFRFIKDQGFIGQFIAKQVTGTIKNPSDDFSMTDREFKLEMGIKVGDTLTWYSLGNFLVTKITDDEVKDTTKFEALDYTKKFNKKYEDTITYPCTMLELAQNICEQCGCELGSTDFKHKDWVIDGNYFQNNESCRDVMKNLGKLAYSWVRVDWDNKVYFDFTKKTTVDSYNKVTSHEYYSLTTQKEKKIVNRVVIGYGSIDGEQTKVEDTASIEANGLCEITIFDNPLVYSQELREKAIVGASDLLGLEYTPLEMQTIGHPWLKGYELIEATDMEGKVYKTIPFNRTIQYFGHIKSLIKIETETKTNTEYAYESGLKNDFLNAQIQVNKKLGTITSTVDEMTTKVEDITTTTQTSTGGNSLYLKEALESNALEYSINGKCEQSTRSGKNLYNYKDTTTVGDGVTVDEDGWITISYDNTAGTSTVFRNYYTNNLNLKTNTNYNIIMEVKNVSTTGDSNIYPTSSYSTTQGQFINNASYKMSDLSNNTVKQFIQTTKNSFDGITAGLRTFASFGAGTKGSITFRLSVLEDITVTANNFEYEAFGASPSPDYPSEIKTIKGIRNLFDYKNASILNAYIGTADNQTTITAHGYNRMTYLHIEPNTTYTVNKLISQQFSLGYCTEEPVVGVVCRGVIDGTKIAYDGVTRHSLTITTDDNANYLVIRYINTKNEPDIDLETILKSIQVEQGPVAHSYVPYGTYEKIRITEKNLCNGINQGFFINSITTLAGLTNGDTGLIIPTNGVNTYTIFTTDVQTRYRIACTNVIPTDKTGIAVFNGINKDGTNDTITINTTNYKYLIVNATDLSKIQIEQGSIATDYEPYKEKEVLIDLAKKNLFDKDNTNELNAWINATNGLLTTNTNTNSVIVDVEKNTDYTISRLASDKFRIGFYSSIPTGDETLVNYKSNDTGNIITANSGDNTYLIIYYYNNNSGSYTKQEILKAQMQTIVMN